MRCCLLKKFLSSIVFQQKSPDLITATLSFSRLFGQKSKKSSGQKIFQSRFSNVLLCVSAVINRLGKFFLFFSFFWARTQQQGKEQRGTPSCRLMQIQMNLNFPNDDGENEAMATTHTTQQRLVNFGIFIIFRRKEKKKKKTDDIYSISHLSFLSSVYPLTACNYRCTRGRAKCSTFPPGAFNCIYAISKCSA